MLSVKFAGVKLKMGESESVLETKGLGSIDLRKNFGGEYVVGIINFWLMCSSIGNSVVRSEAFLVM